MPGLIRISALFSLLLLPLQPVIGGDEAPYLAAAQKASAEYGQALKAELTAAIKQGGPLAAVEACNLRAPQIATTVSSENDLQISRVSLKNRNPDAAPEDWQRTVLNLFEQKQLEGADPSTLAWSDTVDTGAGQQFRFMKAIPTAPICLACHGENIAEPLAEKITELYPEDKATGYTQGQIRGAFVVTKYLN